MLSFYADIFASTNVTILLHSFVNFHFSVCSNWRNSQEGNADRSKAHVGHDGTIKQSV